MCGKPEEHSLKDVFLFWTKVKKRSNTEVLDNYMALMKKQGLKILDSMIPISVAMTRNSHRGHVPISAARSFHRRQDSLKAADCRNWQTN